MKKTMLIFVVAVLVALSACGSNENHEESAVQAEYGVPEEDADSTAHENAGEGVVSETYEYETDIIRYGEPILGKFTFRKDVKKTETDHAVYYFETSVNEQERQACIAETERVLACMDGVMPKVEIVVLLPESCDGIFVEDHRLYTSLRSENFTEFLAGILLAAYSEWGNYGLAYGYANYLCREAGLEYREADSLIPMGEPELYDLNLLCFDEKFVTLQDVEASKNNACYFVNAYLSAHSEAELLELLSDSGTVEGVRKANEELEAFCAANGAECSLTEIRYRYGGVTFDYVAACEYAAFYIDKDWQDIYWEVNSKVSENFLHEDYTEVKDFFECNARQMGQYQEFFEFNSYNNDLRIVLTNDFNRSSTIIGFYNAESHSIYLRTVVSLMHEYIHSVMSGRCDFDNWWRTEGSARYFSHKYYNDYLYSMTDIYYEDKTEIWLQEFQDSLGRPLDIKIDSRALDDMSAFVYGDTDPNWSYAAASSFVGYLVDQYGERSVIEYICSEDEYHTEWGKSYEELVQDWNEYINENYSWYKME